MDDHVQHLINRRRRDDLREHGLVRTTRVARAHADISRWHSSIAVYLVACASADGGAAAWTLAYVAAIFSDIFDGVIARRLAALPGSHTQHGTAAIEMEKLRTADSMADIALFLALSFSTWRLHPDVLADYRAALLSAVVAQLANFAASLIYQVWADALLPNSGG